MRCRECGEGFTVAPGARGRPRRRCYKCSPERRGQYGRSKKTQRENKEEVASSDGPHCPWCGAYPDGQSESYPFCNPAHRSFFAERVADAQQQQKIRALKGPTRCR